MYKKFDLSLESSPFIILCGRIEDVKKCFVVVNNFKFPADNLTKAVEFCFKCYKALQLDFSECCKHVWNFIQKRPYKISLDKGQTLTCVDTLVRNLDSAVNKKSKT